MEGRVHETPSAGRSLCGPFGELSDSERPKRSGRGRNIRIKLRRLSRTRWQGRIGLSVARWPDRRLYRRSADDLSRALTAWPEFGLDDPCRGQVERRGHHKPVGLYFDDVQVGSRPGPGQSAPAPIGAQVQEGLGPVRANGPRPVPVAWCSAVLHGFARRGVGEDAAFGEKDHETCTDQIVHPRGVGVNRHPLRHDGSGACASADIEPNGPHVRAGRALVHGVPG